MATEKQIEANRRNALKSTGPKSAISKAMIATNSVTHGLLTRGIQIRGEDHHELVAFRERMLAQLAPEGEVESYLAERVIVNSWRLGRAGRYEAEVIDATMREMRAERENKPHLFSCHPPLMQHDAVRRCLNDGSYDKLARYETHIENGLYKALHELQRIQAERKGRAVQTPVALDVIVTGTSKDE